MLKRKQLASKSVTTGLPDIFGFYDCIDHSFKLSAVKSGKLKVSLFAYVIRQVRISRQKLSPASDNYMYYSMDRWMLTLNSRG